MDRLRGAWGVIKTANGLSLFYSIAWLKLSIMNEGFIIIGFVLLFFIFHTYRAQKDRELTRKRFLDFNDIIHKIPDFTPSQRVDGVMCAYVFAVDKEHRKVAYLNGIRPRVFSFEDIMSVELCEDSATIASKSTMRTIGGTLVGGAIAGGAGAVVGGLSGNTNIKKEVSTVKVKIMLRNLERPAVIIKCFDYVSMAHSEVAKNNNLSWNIYKRGLGHAKKIIDLVSVIIDDVDHSEKIDLHSSNTTANGTMLVADELAKLVDLKNKGILTEEEFLKQKNKLLS